MPIAETNVEVWVTKHEENKSPLFGGWEVHWERTDKTHPNAKRVADDIIKSLNDPLNEDDLIELLEEKIVD